MIKYLVPRIRQEIFVFPSEYFIYSMFHALFWRALWLCEVKAQMFWAPHLSEDLICQAAECHELPLTQKVFRTSCTFPGLSPRWLMSKPLQELRASKREPGFATPVQVRRRPSIPLTGVGFGNAELHNGFRSVQKGLDIHEPQDVRPILKKILKIKAKHLLYLTFILARDIFITEKSKYFPFLSK